MEFGEFLNNSGAVSSVSHTKPAAISVKYFDCSFSVADKGVNCERNKKFALGGVDVLVKEFFELALTVVKVIGCESPEVH